MLPGAKKMGLNNIQIDPKQMAHIEAIVLSMTPEERSNLSESMKVFMNMKDKYPGYLRFPQWPQYPFR